MPSAAAPASGTLLCWSLENCTGSERDRPCRHVLICRFAAARMNPSHQSQRRTNVWREVTSPARGPMLQHDLPGSLAATHWQRTRASWRPCVPWQGRHGCARLRSTQLTSTPQNVTKSRWVNPQRLLRVRPPPDGLLVCAQRTDANGKMRFDPTCGV